MKTFVIGDIHGGYRALLQCLERSKFNKEKDLLIVLGDVVDGWSESFEVVEELLTIKNKVCIMGNHDKWFYDYLLYGSIPNIWYSQGGESTYKSYLNRSKEDKSRHLTYFDECKLYHIDEKNRGFVHAGYTSIKGLGHEFREENYYWDRELWKIALEAKEKDQLELILSKHDEVYIGHTTTMYYDSINPMNACNVWNLDTGGGYSGKLTIMNIDTKEYWQSDLLKTLYKEEKGR